MKAWLTAKEEEAERMAQEEAERRRRERREAGVPEMNGGSSDSDDYDEHVPGSGLE